jgi:D-tyrosyl-tRNA(Tyr) deacylase
MEVVAMYEKQREQLMQEQAHLRQEVNRLLSEMKQRENQAVTASRPASAAATAWTSVHTTGDEVQPQRTHC